MFLGFEPDPSLNIAARVRGPNVSFLISFPSFLFVFSHNLTMAVQFSVVS